MNAVARHPGAMIRMFVHLVVYILAATMIVPFAWMVLTSLKTRTEALGEMGADGTLQVHILPETLQWSNYREAWAQAQLGDFYVNSLVVAIVVTILSGVHNALAGFAFAKLRFAGRRLVFATILGTMMLPFQVYFIFAYLICGWLGYHDSLQALIVPFLASAFGIFYMRQSIERVPDDLLDAGRIDGLTNLELFLDIVLPSIRPAVAALAIFTFMATWNSFFWPLIVIDSNEHFTLPLAVAALAGQYYTDSWPVQMAAATLITLPVVIVFIVFQRAFVEGITLTGIKG